MRISDWSSDVCSSDLSKVDHLIIGGGMANTFLAARGVDVGKSLCEHDLVDTANAIFEAADAAGCTIHLPYDVVVAKQFAPNPPTRTVNVHEVAADEMILDVGPDRKSTRLNSSHYCAHRMPSSACKKHT